MFNKDLMYICKWVDEIPDGTTVRLDSDGEICFMGEYFKDFYPESVLAENHPCFIPACSFMHTGKDYTREDFLACKEYLATLDAPVEGGTDLVVEKVKLRVQEITKRHEQALADELKPLIEVLQRKGETL